MLENHHLTQISQEKIQDSINLYLMKTSESSHKSRR